MPVGDDHERPIPHLPALIDAARATGLDVELVSYQQHLSDRPTPSVSVTGELRSGARANLLPNTYGVRPHQKVERARVEHLLERYAEPLAALVEGEWPAELLSEAWGLLHLNGAHDSVCGCSTDEVADDVDARTAAASEIGYEIVSDALGRVAASVREEGTLVFNPSPFERFGVPGLGWRVFDDFDPAPVRLSPWIDGEYVVIPADPAPFRVRIEDQGDVGDLYTFEASGAPEIADATVRDDEAHLGSGRSDVSISAWQVPGEDLVRLHIELTNDAPDHRVRLLVETDGSVGTSLAGAPFEIVARPREGEGGESEPPSRWWPARGFVCAGSVGVLSEGVFEYEVTDDALAVTLVRCTGNISRQSLTTRKVVAGPDVPTPGAQGISTHTFELGLCRGIGWDGDDRSVGALRPRSISHKDDGGRRPTSGGIVPRGGRSRAVFDTAERREPDGYGVESNGGERYGFGRQPPGRPRSQRYRAGSSGGCTNLERTQSNGAV